MFYTDPAFWVSVTGVITAITALVKVINHKESDDPHPSAPILPPEAKP